MRYEDTPRKLKDLPPDQLLEVWSRPIDGGYPALLQFAANKLIDTSLPEAKRVIKRLLYERGLLPLSRRPTSHDYQRAKERWRAEWFDVDLI